MKYCRYLAADGPRYAVVEDREGAPWAVHPMPAPPEDRGAASAVRHTEFTPLSMAALEEHARLLVPVMPSKIVCVGRNYRDHATELGNDVPKEPLLFLKPPSSLLPPGGTVRMPALSKRVDFEGELAIVMGRRCSKFQGDAALAKNYLRGYTCLNDVTARDIQKSDPQWTRGKGYDTFCPVGPLVTDELDAIGGNVQLTTSVNGDVRQQGETKDFLFPIAELLTYISACMTLEVGDVIATGTPAGVGPVQAGETVEVTIPGIGVLRNVFVAE